jgi:hypothetical protein
MTPPRYSAAQIAQVCHEANRGLQAVHAVYGIPVAASWDEFPEDERAGVIAGVEHALGGASPDELHARWCEGKTADGWRYGPVKDNDAKTHPCLVAYDRLPVQQRDKDDLFAAVVDALDDERPVEFDSDGRDPETVALTAHFGYAHLPDDLAPLSKACAMLAALMFNNLADNPELRAGLRSLLQAKDSFVRTAVAARG